MHEQYEYTRFRVRPDAWPPVLEAVRTRGAAAVEAAGGSLYALFTGQIGVPSDEGFVITAWPDGPPAGAAPSPLDGVNAVESARGERLVATARPLRPDPPDAPGVYAHRWFSIAERDWPEFLELSEAAWPSFEAAHGAEIVGLWRSLEAAAPDARVLLVTRYPSLAVWESSRAPRDAKGEEHAHARRFARRHALTRSTVVVTTRLHPVAKRKTLSGA